jgi:hypothetical protein
LYVTAYTEIAIAEDDSPKARPDRSGVTLNRAAATRLSASRKFRLPDVLARGADRVGPQLIRHTNDGFEMKTLPDQQSAS